MQKHIMKKKKLVIHTMLIAHEYITYQITLFDKNSLQKHISYNAIQN